MRSDSFSKITVVTPSYNQGQFLEQTIQSVLGQNYPNLEYMVVDGGSKDGSIDIIKRYGDRLAWWVSEKDKGQSDAINKGFRRATGDIFAWLNSDDMHCPGALANVGRFFCEHPEFDAVVGDQESIDKHGRLLDLKKAVRVNFRRTLYSGCSVPQPATFFTRKAYEKTGEVDPNLHYLLDYEYFLRMQARGLRFGLIKAPLARFRFHGESKTLTEYRRRFWDDFGKVQDRYLTFPFSGTSREWYRRGMKWLFRLELYAVRAVTRGVLVPFQTTRARNRLEAPFPVCP
jgi:glycosyltransferase involved in cell wall biosynthesis